MNDTLPLMRGDRGFKVSLLIWLLVTCFASYVVFSFVSNKESFNRVPIIVSYSCILLSSLFYLKTLYKGATDQYRLVPLDNQRFKIIDGNHEIFEGAPSDLYYFDTDQCGIFIHPTEQEVYRLLRKDIPDSFSIQFNKPIKKAKSQ